MNPTIHITGVVMMPIVKNSTPAIVEKNEAVASFTRFVSLMLAKLTTHNTSRNPIPSHDPVMSFMALNNWPVVLALVSPVRL